MVAVLAVNKPQQIIFLARFDTILDGVAAGGPSGFRCHVPCVLAALLVHLNIWWSRGST